MAEKSWPTTHSLVTLTIAGKPFDLRRSDVLKVLRDVEPEPIFSHFFVPRDKARRRYSGQSHLYTTGCGQFSELRIASGILDDRDRWSYTVNLHLKTDSVFEWHPAKLIERITSTVSARISTWRSFPGCSSA